MRGGRAVHSPSYLAAMLIGLDGNPLNVNSGRRCVLVVKCFLRLQIAPRLLGHNPRVGMSGLVDVDVLNPGLARIHLQVLGK